MFIKLWNVKAFLHRPIGPCKTKTKQNHDEIKMSSPFLRTPGLFVRLFRHKVHPRLRCIDDSFFSSLFSAPFTADISAMKSGSGHEDLAFMYY